MRYLKKKLLPFPLNVLFYPTSSPDLTATKHTMMLSRRITMRQYWHVICYGFKIKYQHQLTRKVSTDNWNR